MYLLASLIRAVVKKSILRRPSPLQSGRNAQLAVIAEQIHRLNTFFTIRVTGLAKRIILK
jgi:hypothetical protein